MPSQNRWSATGYPGSAGAVPQAVATGRERTWNNTPNFGSLPKDQKPVNGYVDFRYETRQSPGFYQILTPTGGLPYFTFGPGFRFENGAITGGIDSILESQLSWNSELARLRNTTIVKALVKVADAKVNVAVAYAEAKKTSDLIYETASRIDRAYRAFRKGDLKGVAKNLNITPKRLHKSWLEYKYGWMPLLMDVKGAAEFFAQQHVGRSPKFTIKASETKSGSTSWNIPYVPYGGGSSNISVALSVSVEYKVKLWCELSSPHYAAVQQLGLTNPALVAWELVPFSFVFDWFVQVGDWLTALTAQQGVTIYRKMYSITETAGYQATQPATFRSDVAYSYEVAASEWAGSRRRYERSIPDLSLFDLYPPVTNSFNFPKLVTSLALLQANYRGSSRTSRL